MKATQLENRLIQFAIAVVVMCEKIESGFAAEHLAKQLIRPATSSGANYEKARSGEAVRLRKWTNFSRDFPFFTMFTNASHFTQAAGKLFLFK